MEYNLENKNIKGIIESILFAAGKEVSKKELIMILELSKSEIENIVSEMKQEYIDLNRGIEIIEINDNYQMCSKKEYHEYIYPVVDKRSKPNLSNAAIETLSIIAYNPKITRAEIENIRGVSADGCVYKLLEYELIEEAGKIDLPGKPMSYKTTDEFLKMFGYSSLDELPKLPKYKLDENHQIVIDEILEEKNSDIEDKLKDEGE